MQNSRRKFIQNTGIALLSIGMTPRTLWSKNTSADAKTLIGIQLYAVRDNMFKDPLGTLKALSKMGRNHHLTYPMWILLFAVVCMSRIKVVSPDFVCSKDPKKFQGTVFCWICMHGWKASRKQAKKKGDRLLCRLFPH